MSVGSGIRVVGTVTGLVGLVLAFGYPVLGQTDVAPAEVAPAETSVIPATEAPATRALDDTGGEQIEGGVDPVAQSITGGEAVADPQATLEGIESSISLSEDRIEALRAEIADLEGDRTRQNAALIAAAQRVKLAEIEVADVEARLDDLIVAEFEVRGRLDGADTEIANVLAALARISRNPPPALIVDPTDALGSARSAILIAAILPQLQERAEIVTADLTELTGIKTQVLAEEQLLLANFAVLEEEQLRIATLITARRQGVAVMTEDLAAEEAEAVALAARAATLQELIGRLGDRARTVTAATPPVDPDAPQTLTPEAIQVALADLARTEPAIPFEAARGYLALPSNGVNVVDYGANDGMGGIAQGVSIVTRAEAQVVAPADGYVLYKGPYLNYGQIIILNTGQSYTALLAGLETVTVDIGQFVLLGEPVGTMGSRTIGRTVTTSAGNSQPTLYIELRQDNEPIDPTDWWAPPAETT